jgi:nucleotide-binding universal stress UspA family protein
MEATTRVLLGYDGSENANRALDYLAELLPGAELTLLTVWDGVATTTARASLGPLPVQTPGDVTTTERTAAAIAREGLVRARLLPIDAKGETVETHTTTADAILRAADAKEADLIRRLSRDDGGNVIAGCG